MTATALAPVLTTTVRSVDSLGALEDLRRSVRSLGLASVAVRRGLPGANAVVDELSDTASRHGMAPLRRKVEDYRRGQIPAG